MLRAHKIKLAPTKEQVIYFARSCGVARHAYNWALAAWKEQYEAGGKPSEMSLRKQYNALKPVEFPWALEVTKNAPQQAIKNLGTAFQNFFRRVKQGGKPGYPKFKRKGLHDSFRADNGPQKAGEHAVPVDGKSVKLPKCGVVRMRESLRFAGQVISATVSKQADGWYVTLLVDTTDCLSGPLDRKFCRPVEWQMIYSCALPEPQEEIYKCASCVEKNGSFVPQSGIKPEHSCGGLTHSAELNGGCKPSDF